MSNDDLPRVEQTDEGPRLPEYSCPTCGKRFECATTADATAPEQPKPGHLAICVGCAEISIFGEGGSLRTISAEEYATLDAEALRSIVRCLSVIVYYQRSEIAALKAKLPV